MNVFYTNANPLLAARDHCKVHMIKMIVEYSQLLSTAHRILDRDKAFWHDLVSLYRQTHENHPSAIWVRDSKQHYEWLVACLQELHHMYHEYKGDWHKSHRIFKYLKTTPENIPDSGFVAPYLAINKDEYPLIVQDFTQGNINTVEAYRRFQCEKMFHWMIREDKRKMFPTWTIRTPIWWEHFLESK